MGSLTVAATTSGALTSDSRVKGAADKIVERPHLIGTRQSELLLMLIAQKKQPTPLVLAERHVMSTLVKGPFDWATKRIALLCTIVIKQQIFSFVNDNYYYLLKFLAQPPACREHHHL